MPLLTAQQLAAVLAPCELAFAAGWLPHVIAAAERFEINTPARLAAFLAQTAHESMRYRRTAEIWAPESCAWQRGYEGKASLGNTQPGDGARFRGRGLIQLTGRYWYTECSKATGIPCLVTPEALAAQAGAAISAAWYWSRNRCNLLADAGDFDAITRKINPAMLGADQRRAFWTKAKGVLNVPA